MQEGRKVFNNVVFRADFVHAHGAGERSRTPDLFITNELLYQLSYTGIAFEKHTRKSKSQILSVIYLSLRELCWINS